MSSDSTHLVTPTSIRDQLWSDDTPPLVSVLVPAFNQENFIRDAIEGILMQRTTFKVEIIVHDDASTDRTVAIVNEYAEANSKLFRIVERTENQFSKGTRALQYLDSIAKGKYLAVCEGDDFWTAADKLECQVRMLEERPDASGSIHRADGLFEETGETIAGLFGPSEIKPQYEVDDLIVADNFVPTGSIVLRRRADETVPFWISEVPHGDLSILSNAALAGPLLYVDRSMSVYRKHAGGMHSREGTARQAINCIESLVGIGGRLNLAGSRAYKTGLNYRIGQLRSAIDRYENRIGELDRALMSERETNSQILSSRTFRIGMFLGRLLGRNSSTSK